MLTRARRIAAGLYSLGVRKGDRGALLSESRPEWTLTDAMHLCRGDRRSIYPTLTRSGALHSEDSGACALILADRKKFLELKRFSKNVPRLRT